jgi:hypothetical protein
MWAPTVSARHAAYPERTEPKERYDVVTSLPDASTRWRCSGCGNLTRFDVTRTARTREYVHVDLAGEPVVEEREVLAEDVESVRCRWCDGVGTVELVPRPAPGEQGAGPP